VLALAVCLLIQPTEAFEGKYGIRGESAWELEVKRLGSDRILIELSTNGCVGGFDGRAQVSGDTLTASDGKCRITMRRTTAGLDVKQAPGCLPYHGPRCQFAATWVSRAASPRPQRPVGAPTAIGPQASGGVEAPSPAAVQALPSSGRGAPYGIWTFLENGSCVPFGPQGVRLRAGEIDVSFMDWTHFPQTYLDKCVGDVCTFRQRGTHNIWTTRWLGADEIAFRGPHMLTGPGRSESMRSVARRPGSHPDCKTPQFEFTAPPPRQRRP
jgi:hypothetical protein